MIFFFFPDNDSRDVDSLSVRLITDNPESTTSVIQLSRPVPVIKCANSPPLLELQPPPTPVLEEVHGVHFLTPGEQNEQTNDSHGTNDDTQPLKKTELLEYLIRGDGSVTCKMCGEILASRTHWYRHKYKLHSNTSSTLVTSVSGSSSTVTNTVGPHVQPSPLYKCELCSVFFKSKKGYMGHIASRHSSSTPEEEVPVVEEVPPSVIEEKTKKPKDSSTNNNSSKNDIWEKQREREEKLVADIIDRVRRECEAQGAMVSRRGYSRRSTVMNTCN